jgi:D-amino peptidase
MAGAFGVPVVLVTGNASACREAKALLGDDLPCVETQEDLSWESAISISPDDSRRRIRDAVRSVSAGPPQRSPLVLEPPIEIVLEFSTIEDLENANVGGAVRIGDRTVRVEVESPLDLLPRRW